MSTSTIRSKASVNEVGFKYPAHGGRPEQQRDALNAYKGVKMTDTVWQCEQLRAGQVYSKEVFQTLAEAEEFVAKMARVAPDIFCRIEPIEVEKVWN
jgi:hypothetical protein